jgi:hypothetical protein
MTTRSHRLLVEEIVKPLGLVTQPNTLGEYPAGALITASGVVLRSPGMLTQQLKFGMYVGIPYASAAFYTPVLLAPSDSGLFAIARANSGGQWGLSYFFSGFSFGQQLTSGVPFAPITFDINGNVNWTRSRDRFLFTSDQGVLIVDKKAPTTNAETLPRVAGLMPPSGFSANIVISGNPGAISNASGGFAGIVACIRRTYSDGYTVISPPTAMVQVGYPAPFDFSYAIQWFGNRSQLQAGDVLEFYRTPTQTVSGRNIGATVYLSATYTLTSTDIANHITPSILDSTSDARLSRELYTNPGQQGASAAYFPPPIAPIICTFKGYTFYFNRTDAASLTLRVPGGVNNSNPSGAGTLGYARKNAIGSRAFTATFTNTTNTLTAISAADMVGLVVGQQISDSALALNPATITAVGVSSVTVNTTANTTVTKATGSSDVIEVDGSATKVVDWPNLVFLLTSDMLIAGAACEPPPVLSGTFNLDIYSPREFTIRRAFAGGGSFTIRATNQQNYIPPLPGISATALTVSTTAVPNGYCWSELQLPEAVPLTNRGYIGSGTIHAAFPTRDAIWIFTSDGLWRLSGTGGRAGAGFDWRVDLMNSTITISGPHAGCVLRDSVYAYTSEGLAEINDSGIKMLSQGVIGDLLPGPPYSQTATIQVTGDEDKNEVILLINTTGTNGVTYIYNIDQNAFTTRGSDSVNTEANHRVTAYARFLLAPVALDTGSAYVPDPAAGYAFATVDFQPIFGERPFDVKHWIDMTTVFSLESAGKIITPRFNGAAGADHTLVLTSGATGDSRTTYGVPRNAPAMSTALAPGFSKVAYVGSENASRFHGIALRYVDLSNQRRQR